jgi:hypothetical protein
LLPNGLRVLYTKKKFHMMNIDGKWTEKSMRVNLEAYS